MTKQKEYLLYLDDSGSRDPDRHRDGENNEAGWFALGGVMVDASQKDNCDQSIIDFRHSWAQVQDAPLHSYDIRHKKGAFHWLGALPREEQSRFMGELSALITGLPIVVCGCVVDRNGYNARYMTQYGQRRWKLCKTAFSIVVERAAKFALHHQARLRVYVEQTDKVTEGHMRSYFQSLKTEGLPFSEANSAKYSPMTQAEFAKTLYEFKVKTKKSDLMQLADLCLWPICMGRHNPQLMPYRQLLESGKLLDSHCTSSNGLHGVKYSCFD